MNEGSWRMTRPVAWRYQGKDGWGGIWRVTNIDPSVSGFFETPDNWRIEPLYTLPSDQGRMEVTMKDPYWNEVDFRFWEYGDLSIEVNQFAEGAIVLELSDNDSTLSEWMTPEKAKHVAAKLIEAANAVERAGTYKP